MNTFVPKSTTAPIKEIAGHFGVDYDDALHLCDHLNGRDRNSVHQVKALDRVYAKSDKLSDFRTSMRNYVWNISGMVPHMMGTIPY